MVGRDVLIGVAGGLAHAALAACSPVVVAWLHLEHPAPYIEDFRVLLGPRFALAHVLDAAASGISAGLMLTVLLVLFTIILRRRALGAAALMILITGALAVAFHGNLHFMPTTVAIAAVLAFVTVRFGLLSICVLQFVFEMTFAYPIAFGIAPWTTGIAIIPLIVVAALSAWAVKTAMGAQSLFPAED